jgi:uncharacterized protein YbjT (DUF2867 family)
MKLKTCLLFGASGLTGNQLMHRLLSSDAYSKVKIFVRKRMDIQHSKLEQVMTDFDHLSSVKDQITGDEIFLCLGTTMAKAGSKEAFFNVDYTYTMEAARFAADNGVKRAMLISSLGADPNSMIYYSKVKGQVEKDMGKLPFESVVIIRPSLLLGEREEQRLGEKIGSRVINAVSGLMVGPWRKYKGIAADRVADAMIRIAQNPTTGISIVESDQLEKISNNTL